MQIFDGQGRLPCPGGDGRPIGDVFLEAPPQWHELGLTGVLRDEPLRGQLAFGETVRDGGHEAARIRRRYPGEEGGNPVGLWR